MAQDSEHGAVSHVVSIEDRIVICEGRIVPEIHEHRAGKIVGTVQTPFQVIVIVRRLGHRVADRGARNVNPEHHIF